MLTFDEIPMALDRTEGWAYIRKEGPVTKVGHAWFVTGREEAEYALKHPELFSSAEAFEALGSPLPLVPLSFDPPEHTRYRRILQPFFSPRALQAMLPSLQDQIHELIDGLAGKDSVEIVEDLAIPYPSQVFLTLFGLPLDDRDRLIAWKDAIIALAGNAIGNATESDLQPALELFAYLTEAINAKRANPGDDILSQLVTGEDPLNDAEALGLGFLFVLAGLDTVTAAIGFAFARLAADTGLRARIVADPSLIPAFVEEVVRLEPPAPMLPRVATQDLELGGVAIAKGDAVSVCIGGANRDADPDLADPDALDMDRDVNRHFGFGGGPHRCLGSHLARMELKLVLETWHARVPDYGIQPGFTPTMDWPVQTFSLTSVPLVLKH